MDKCLLSSKKMDWGTPQNFFDSVKEEFGPFDIDAAADKSNAKVSNYWDVDSDGLSQDWDSLRVWVNPPYGRGLKKWVKKAAESYAEIVVMLIPARTDTSYFHDYILGKAEIRFIRGRLRFQGADNSAPFPSMLVIWRNK